MLLLTVCGLCLLAVASADVRTRMNGRDISVFDGKKTFAEAKAHCEGMGTHLATICSEQELEDLRAALAAVNYQHANTVELWLGGKSSKPHHNILSMEELTTIVSGDNCRILSNWPGSKPWAVYTKECTQGTRAFICQSGEDSDNCPAVTISLQVDNSFTAFADGKAIGSQNNWGITDTLVASADTEVISIIATNAGGPDGMVFSTSTGIISDEHIRCVGVASEQEANTKYAGWKEANFNDAAWPNAVSNGVIGVGPWGRKPGSEVIDDEAEWIWSASKATVAVCRIHLQVVTISLQVDNSFTAFADGKDIGSQNNWGITDTLVASADTKVISIIATNAGGPDGIVFSTSTGIISDEEIRCVGVASEQEANTKYPGWKEAEYNDAAWPNAISNGVIGVAPWGRKAGSEVIDDEAEWIWSASKANVAVCRIHIHGEPVVVLPIVDPVPVPVKPIVDPVPVPVKPIVDPVPVPVKPIVDPVPVPVKPIVDTEPVAPIVDPRPATTTVGPPITAAPVTCPEKREEFRKNGLPVEPVFQEGSCKFVAKQCNAKKCFCVKPKKGVRNYGKLEVPLGETYDCAKKAKKCHQKLFKILIAQEESGKAASYIPSCTKKGQYQPKQCDAEGTCWCAKKRGKEIKKTRDTNGEAVKC